MRLLSLFFYLLFMLLSRQEPESPHGRDFKVSCSTCHSSKGWQLDTAIYSFDHNRTKFALTGQHTGAGCRQCHTTLVFNETKSECNECHTDVHQATTGLDCARCHTPNSWLVSNITGIHQTSRFPLLGAHRTADCSDCHKSETLVRFDVPGVNCIDCHRENYMATTNPNHSESGFSEDCSPCHPVNSFEWTGAGFNHTFFPLTQGHSGLNCSDCHTSGSYTGLNPDCVACHQTDYNNTTNPNHQSMGFPTTCTTCHSLHPGWKPASYTQHDIQYFPIYSGNHRGTWDSCTECHTNPNNYSQFDCIRCHTGAHRDENYTNAQCYNCHPRGTAGDK
jgi:Zn finger protein HypA/HybF involved in hydrogenase expression